jgi:hypothetical protein
VSAGGPLVVSHGDLHVRHLLVDRDGSVRLWQTRQR